MIDSRNFVKSRPFQAENSNYNLTGTTEEMLQYQLKEENKLALQHDTINDDYTPDYLDTSFNNHLQTKLEDGDILIEELPSLIGSTTDDESDNNIDKPNYLNLKVLIENSVFEINKLSSKLILSLDNYKRIKTVMVEKIEMRDYYNSKLKICQQFITSLTNQQDIDTELLVKVVENNNLLTNKVLELADEISLLSTKLNNHNMSCVLLGYVEDIKLSNLDVDSSFKPNFDKFVNHVVSMSVAKGINLPPPVDSNNIEDKFIWVQLCIDLLISPSSSPNDSTILTIPSTANSPSKANPEENSFLSSSFSPIDGSSKTLQEYKTALNDLRFSHQYLIKEFEYSRESSLKIIQDHRKKIASLEKDLAKYKTNDDATAKDNEISKLRKELNLLKIDKLGTAENDSMSNGILRKQFKKIVSDIQDQYELELKQEKLRAK